MNPNEDLPIWTIDSSEHVISDQYLKLRRDSCTTPQGSKVDTYYIFELKDWASCIIIDKNDDVIMLRHYRHGVREYLMEFIGGGVEEGESPEEAVRREVKEETGYTGGLIYYVGTSYPNPANHTTAVTIAAPIATNVR